VSGLDLFNNQLNGNIPTELGSLSNLNVLYLDYNPLDPTIPDEVETLCAPFAVDCLFP